MATLLLSSSLFLAGAPDGGKQCASEESMHDDRGSPEELVGASNAHGTSTLKLLRIQTYGKQQPSGERRLALARSTGR